jgi:hypothetical protein
VAEPISYAEALAEYYLEKLRQERGAFLRSLAVNLDLEDTLQHSNGRCVLVSVTSTQSPGSNGADPVVARFRNLDLSD